MFDPTRYTDLNRVLEELAHRIQSILGEQCIGIYLQGSFALGGGDPYSDVDFLVVTDGDITPDIEIQLARLHNEFYDFSSPWSQHLEGSYIPAQILKHDDPAKTPIIYVDHGSRELERSAHDNNLVVRWIVRERGITLYGADPKILIAPIDPTALRSEVRATMREWGREVLDGKSNIKSLWGQTYYAISFCRMLYTIETAEVSSKPVALEWARANLDAKWSAIFDSIEHERANPARTIFVDGNAELVSQTIEFIRYSLQRLELS